MYYSRAIVVHYRSKAAQEEMGLLSIILSLIMMKQSNISEGMRPGNWYIT